MRSISRFLSRKKGCAAGSTVDMKEDREHVYVKVVDYKSGSRGVFARRCWYYRLQPVYT